jgi:c-di-AMP phosphodiesterase-like protein
MSFHAPLTNFSALSGIHWPMFISFSYAKYCIFVLFINQQLFEIFVLYVFVAFQSQYSLEQVNVYRSQYQQRERSHLQTMKAINGFTILIYSMLIAQNWVSYFLLKQGYYGTYSGDENED